MSLASPQLAGRFFTTVCPGHHKELDTTEWPASLGIVQNCFNREEIFS